MAGVASLRVALFAFVVGVILALPGAAGAAECAGASSVARKAQRTQIRDAVLCLVNAERRQRRLEPLRMSSRLRHAAREHSQDMVARRYFSHTSPGGGGMVDRARKHGYLKGSWSLAENIAMGGGEMSSPARIVEMWMKSAGHRENILRPDLRDAGVGVAFRAADGRAGATYTLMLGRRGR